jgi:prepilin-type N-terminal cleavage/methylation domain-containing protein
MRHPGFSLVELIVVIAIIAVLIGLLLPALAGSMARAREMKCLANAQQLAAVMIAYAESNRSMLPMVPTASLDPATNQHVYGGLAGFFSLNQVGDGLHQGFIGGTYLNGMQEPILAPYLSSLSSLTCPSDKEDRYYGTPYAPAGNMSYTSAVPLRPRSPGNDGSKVVSYNISYAYFAGRRIDRETMLILGDETNGPDLGEHAWYGSPGVGTGGTTPNSIAAGAAYVGKFAPVDNHGAAGGNFAFSDGSARFERDRNISPNPSIID